MKYGVGGPDRGPGYDPDVSSYDHLVSIDRAGEQHLQAVVQSAVPEGP